MSRLQSAMIIAGIHHPDNVSGEKFIQLQPSDTTMTKDILTACYDLTRTELKETRATENVFRQLLKNLGCYPVKKVFPGYGASAHYAGTLPYSATGSPFTLNRDGLLASTKNVYVADGSGFTFLPAKGPTLTLMANAHNTALNLLKHA